MDEDGRDKVCIEIEIICLFEFAYFWSELKSYTNQIIYLLVRVFLKV